MPISASATPHIARFTIWSALPVEKLVAIAIAAANAPADLKVLKQNLRAAGAEYFVVGLGSNAPEIAWADADTTQFFKLFENADSAVYRIDGLH